VRAAPRSPTRCSVSTTRAGACRSHGPRTSTFPLAYNEAGKAYDPRYPFGYGLSYTRFDLGRVRVQGTRVSVKVRNVGPTAGEHTVLAFVVGADGVRRLAGFTRVDLRPHQQTTARMTLSAPPGSASVEVR
jgi:hypothetical protein